MPWPWLKKLSKLFQSFWCIQIKANIIIDRNILLIVKTQCIQMKAKIIRDTNFNWNPLFIVKIQIIFFNLWRHPEPNLLNWTHTRSKLVAKSWTSPFFLIYQDRVKLQVKHKPEKIYLKLTIKLKSLGGSKMGENNWFFLPI